MPIKAELLEILVCPETKQSLSVATSEQLQTLNAAIEAGKVRNRGGNTIPKPIENGLVREDGSVLYPFDGEIPIMLIEESIEI